MERRKLKILCLHGRRQTSEAFRQKIGSFRKSLSKLAEFYFIEAPHTITTLPPQGGEMDMDKDCRSWWFTSKDGHYISANPSNCDEGFCESIETIRRHLENPENKYDGLMGFSQGATLAAILCSMAQSSSFPNAFRFVILVAGFKSLCAQHSIFYQDKLKIPSLHVIGDGDTVISKERSEALKDLFSDVEILRHPGGHYVPAAKEFRQIYLDFLNKFV